MMQCCYDAWARKGYPAGTWRCPVCGFFEVMDISATEYVRAPFYIGAQMMRLITWTSMQTLFNSDGAIIEHISRRTHER